MYLFFYVSGSQTLHLSDPVFLRTQDKKQPVPKVTQQTMAGKRVTVFFLNPKVFNFEEVKQTKPKLTFCPSASAAISGAS